MPCGQIIRGISGFFYVRSSNEVIQCRPRGIFKYEKKKLIPLVGDFVEFEKTDARNGVITAIQKRKTELIRPPVANVEQAVIISSLRYPTFQYVGIDRFLVYGEYKRLDLVICITKTDLVEDQGEVSAIRAIYEKIGYPVIATSTYSKVGLTKLQQNLSQKTSVFAGESGVGKSSLLQQLIPDHSILTGVVSQRLGRGKHTTRAVELLPLSGGGQVADTPGFSKLSLKEIAPSLLGDFFPEIKEHAYDCYYRDCYHIREPNCEVLEGVERGSIHRNRYQSYRIFLEELQNDREGYNRW